MGKDWQDKVRLLRIVVLELARATIGLRCPSQDLFYFHFHPLTLLLNVLCMGYAQGNALS